MNKQNGSNQPQAREHKIGSTTYLVSHSFKKDAKEDAAAKMARVVRNETLKMMRERKINAF